MRQTASWLRRGRERRRQRRGDPGAAAPPEEPAVEIEVDAAGEGNYTIMAFNDQLFGGDQVVNFPLGGIFLQVPVEVEGFFADTLVGDIYKDVYAGWYSVRDEAYYAESETALGDGGVRVGPQGTPVEWVEEESYFFRLSNFQDRLLAHYEAHPEFIGPAERRNEVVSFVKSGLRDLSISRTTFDWGVPVPGDPDHVMYVWVDALTNYITGVGFPNDSDPLWRFWPADLHIIGKDIVRFHAVYWPAFLMSAGVDLPRCVFGHGFLFNRGEKMSKSIGNVVDPFVRNFFARMVSGESMR